MASDPESTLRRAREAARVRLADRRDELAAVVAEAGAESGVADDEHDPDGSPVSAQRILAAALVEQAEAEIAALDRAWQRLRDGTYGACEACGRPIAPDRLAARPEALQCTPCARESERPRLGRARA